MSISFWPQGLQHTRFLCPPLSPGVYSNSSPLRWWCHKNHLTLCRHLLLLPSISPSISVFSHESALHIRWPFGASASMLVFPMNIQGWLPLGLAGLISLQFMGLSRVLPSTTVQKHQFFSPQPSLWSNSH